MTTTSSTPRRLERTEGQIEMIGKLRTFQKRHQRLAEQFAELDKERADLYIEARSIDPPVTVADIAEIFGITDAAVAQMIKRRNAAVAAAPKRSRRAASK